MSNEKLKSNQSQLDLLPNPPRSSQGNGRLEDRTKEALLETSLKAAHGSLESYRNRVQELLEENEIVREKLGQQEQDVMDLVTVFRGETEERETKISDLTRDLANAKEEHETIMKEMQHKYDMQIEELKSSVAEKDANMQLIQQELHVIKDFRKKRQQLFRELETQKQEVQDMDRRYKEILSKMEKKFLEEKIRLQREANRKISELAAKAHKEAVSNLTETQRSVFKENVRMAEALRYHIQEREELARQHDSMTETHREMTHEKKLHDEIVKQKILQSKAQGLKVQELEEKIQELEFSLSFVIREFERERQLIGNLTRGELDDVRRVADILRQKLKEKTKEMKYVKALAKKVYKERSDLEKFFLDSLRIIREEISKEKRKATEKKALDHRERIRQKKLMDPASASAPSATNLPTDRQIDISELTWADREKLLRVLFSKMNGVLTDPTVDDDLNDDFQPPYSPISTATASRATTAASQKSNLYEARSQISDPDSFTNPANFGSEQIITQADHVFPGSSISLEKQ